MNEREPQGDVDPNREVEAGGAEFERLGEERQSSLLGELWHFIVESRNWWLIPIVVVLLLVSLLVVLSGTGAAPFIYTLF